MTTTLGGLTLMTPPTEEPVTLAEAKLYLRIDHDVEDGLLSALLVAAREYVEMYTRRQLVTATWELTLDTWPACIRPPRPPLQAVTALTYLDSTATLQTLDPSAYQVDITVEPGRIVPAAGASWPALAPVPGAARVRYTAGFGAAAAVPETYKAAIKLLLGDLYEHREARDEGAFPDNPTVARLLWGVSILEVG